jgi:hypothetical protein
MNTDADRCGPWNVRPRPMSDRVREDGPVRPRMTPGPIGGRTILRRRRRPVGLPSDHLLPGSEPAGARAGRIPARASVRPIRPGADRRRVIEQPGPLLLGGQPRELRTPRVVGREERLLAVQDRSVPARGVIPASRGRPVVEGVLPRPVARVLPDGRAGE